MTKSKNLEHYIAFLDYEDSADIPFDAIAAKYNDVTANKLRGMMRSAKHNETIYIALIDQLGVDPEDIPLWFKRPKRITIGRKKKRVYRVKEPVSVTPQLPAYTIQPQKPALPEARTRAVHWTSEMLPILEIGKDLPPPDPLPAYGNNSIKMSNDLPPPDTLLACEKYSIEMSKMLRAYANTMPCEKKRERQESNNMNWLIAYILGNQRPQEPTIRIDVTKEEYDKALEQIRQQRDLLLQRQEVKAPPSEPINLDLINARQERIKLFKETFKSVKEAQDRDFDNALVLFKTVSDSLQEQKAKRLAMNFPSIWNPYNNAFGEHTFKSLYKNKYNE